MSLFVCKQTLRRALARFLIIGINMISFLLQSWIKHDHAFEEKKSSFETGHVILDSVLQSLFVLVVRITRIGFKIDKTIQKQFSIEEIVSLHT